MNCVPGIMPFRMKKRGIAMLLALTGLSQNSQARDYFDPAFIEGERLSGAALDLSAFEEGAQSPGRYRVDILINQQKVDNREVEFQRAVDGYRLEACLPVALLQNYGVKTELYPELRGKNDCANLTAIPAARAEFQFNSQQLVLSLPQTAITAQIRGYVDPALWDEGINALMLNYSLRGDSTTARDKAGDDSHSQFATLRPGINFGPWRFRNYSSWSRDGEGNQSWDSIYSYLQRNIISLRSQLTLGDSSTPGDVFDPVSWRGAQIASDDEMLPDSLRGYAPVVRGIARSNALVVIRQGGYVIYQNNVAPGPFEITDMYATGGSGDLQVTVKEADGSEQRFTVPFASLPVLQREGQLKYAISAGQYRAYDSRIKKSKFMQATAIYGLPYGLTIYGGVQEATKYHSLLTGVGTNLGDIGAFSVDLTSARSEPERQQKSSGQSWRFRYSKNIAPTGTHFAIAGYRYSTRGYYDLEDVLSSYGNPYALNEQRRNRAEMTLSQSFAPGWGTLTLSAIREDYWTGGNPSATYSLSYNNNWHDISYGVSWSYNKNGSAADTGTPHDYDKDQIVSLTVSVPLSSPARNTSVSYTTSSSRNQGEIHSVSLNGNALDNDALNWSVQQNYATKDVGYSGNLNADYKGTYGQLNVGYSYDRHISSLNYGLQGSVLAHSDGITLSQPLGETNVLVKAPGASGVDIQNQPGAKTDFRGYTALSNAAPYRKNDVILNPETLPEEVELELTSRTVIPTRGAIVRSEYRANVGQRAVFTLRQRNNLVVPFGAEARLIEKDTLRSSFIVGDNGELYASGLPEKGVLNIQWGGDASNKCQVEYQLPMSKTAPALVYWSGICK